MRCGSNHCSADATGMLEYYYHDGTSIGLELACTSCSDQYSIVCDAVYDEHGFAVYRPSPTFYRDVFSEAQLLAKRQAAAHAEYETEWRSRGFTLQMCESCRTNHPVQHMKSGWCGGCLAEQ